MVKASRHLKSIRLILTELFNLIIYKSIEHNTDDTRTAVQALMLVQS